MTSMSVKNLKTFVDQMELTKQQHLIGDQILKEIRARVGFLNEVGLDYLSLSRATGTLSGGEAQRIRLATQIGSGLVEDKFLTQLFLPYRSTSAVFIENIH